MQSKNRLVTSQRPSAEWDEQKFRIHFKKRIDEDSGCLEDILNINPIHPGHYRQLSTRVASYPAFKWKALDKADDEIVHSEKVFCSDNKLVLTILNGDETKIRTCYHMHLKGTKHGADPSGQESHEELSVKLEEWLHSRKLRGKSRNIRKVHGFI